MTKLFSPPYRADAFPRSHPDETYATRYQRRFWRSEPQGISVWVTAAGAVTYVDPQDATATWFRGGYIYEVSDAMAAILTAAGFTTTTSLINPRDPGGDVYGGSSAPQTWNDADLLTWNELEAFIWDELSA